MEGGGSQDFDARIEQLAREIMRMADEGKPIVSFMGMIGAGKSTIGRRVVEKLEELGERVAYFTERLPQPLFSMFCENPELYAEDTQMCMLSIRTEILTEARALIASGRVRIVVMERSAFEDYVFLETNIEGGNIPASIIPAYNRTREWSMERAAPLIWFVHVQVTLDISTFRMHTRGNEDERKAYEADEKRKAYFARLSRKYDDDSPWMIEMRSKFRVLPFDNRDEHSPLRESVKSIEFAEIAA